MEDGKEQWYKKAPVNEIRWSELYVKNSDKLYAPNQLIPKSHYEKYFKPREEENRASKFRKLLDGAKRELII